MANYGGVGAERGAGEVVEWKWSGERGLQREVKVRTGTLRSSYHPVHKQVSKEFRCS